MAKKKTEHKVTKLYTIEIKHYEDGSSVMNRENNGFTAIEMLGFLTFISNDIIRIINETVAPIDKINIKSKKASLM